MKFFLIPFLSFVLLPVLCQAADEAYDNKIDNSAAYIQKWEDTEEQIATDPSARQRLLDSFSQPASAEEIKAATKFLMSRIANSETDIGYYVAFGRLSWAVGSENNITSTKNSSAIISAAALLILQTDLARCENKQPGKEIYIETIKTLKEPLYYLQLVDAKTRVLILDEAMKFEIKIDQRKGNPLICGPNPAGTDIVYIKDAQWQAERLKIRNGFVQSLSPKP